jgi:hypothetical protein
VRRFLHLCRKDPYVSKDDNPVTRLIQTEDHVKKLLPTFTPTDHQDILLSRDSESLRLQKTG